MMGLTKKNQLSLHHGLILSLKNKLDKTKANFLLLVTALPLVLLITTGKIVGSANADEIYTVQSGDTLWEISEKLLKDAQHWKILQSYNNIINPYKLVPNSQILVPDSLLKKTELAIVRHFKGNVTIADTSGKTKKLNQGNPISSGDVISTGDSASVSIKFISGSSSILQENSQLDVKNIDISNKKENIQLHLWQGVIENNVNPTKNPNSRFIISTPSAVASVRGTIFRVANDPLTQQFRTEVLQGEVAVSSEGESKVIEKGYGIVVKHGNPPQTITKLLSNVNLSALPKKYINPPFFFQFPVLDLASGYRVEISRGNIFSTPIFSRDIITPSFKLNTLENGTYTLKAFAYDKSGLGGKTELHRFEINIKPKSPLPKLPELIFPDDKMLIDNKSFDFQWTASGNRYHFQLSDNKEFTELLIDIFPYYFTSLSISDRLPSGIYYWHVATLDQKNKSKNFTHSKSFRITPSTPILEQAKYDDGKIKLKWNAAKSNSLYQIQISNDKNFSHLIINEKIKENGYVYTTNIVENYFIHIKPIEQDGYKGKYSKTLHLQLVKKGFFGRELQNITYQ